MGYKLKRILIYPDGVTEKQVRPNNIIECDFTKSDYGFAYKGQNGSVSSYGRGSNGFYGTFIYGNSDVYWGIPSTIYSVGSPKKIELTVIGNTQKFGGGLYYYVSGTTKVLRHYTALRVLWGTQNSSVSETLPANQQIKLTIDFENKTIYSSYSSNSIALTDNAISAFYTDWGNGNVNIEAAAYENGGTTYIKNATFYF